MHLSGTSGGKPFEMTNTYKSRRIGGNCDSEEMANKMKGQAAVAQSQACDSGKGDTAQKVYMARLLMDEKTCPGKKQAFCDAVRTDAPRDARVFAAIIEADKNPETQVARGCGLNMDATNKALCKTLNRNNAGELARFCPAEAKVFRENERRKACEGRSFTGKDDLSKCLVGKVSNEGDTTIEATDPSTAKSKNKPAGTPTTTTPSSEPLVNPTPAQNPNPTEALIDGAKKLKGLFGF